MDNIWRKGAWNKKKKKKKQKNVWGGKKRGKAECKGRWGGEERGETNFETGNGRLTADGPGGD